MALLLEGGPHVKQSRTDFECGVRRVEGWMTA